MKNSQLLKITKMFTSYLICLQFFFKNDPAHHTNTKYCNISTSTTRQFISCYLEGERYDVNYVCILLSSALAILYLKDLPSQPSVFNPTTSFYCFLLGQDFSYPCGAESSVSSPWFILHVRRVSQHSVQDFIGDVASW